MSEVSSEYLASLLNKARQNALLEAPSEEVLELESHKITPLNPGVLPTPYFTLGKRKTDASSLRDPALEAAEQASSSFVVPAPPLPPPELSKSGKPLTKRERKAVSISFIIKASTKFFQLRKQTAGSDWFDLPAPAEADLPRLYREVESLRLRNQLDPKRFYRKEEGEGKGIKGLPKYFAIGTILPSTTPFGTASTDNLTRAKRKRTLVDELVDDAETKRYAKKKFEDLQTARGAKGRNTLNDKKAKRRPKW
ncbi:Fcf2 pre-rRNA processing-domain-containing protein [Mycena amicta]|nr:Fcf2 pre-rRNA processing-domain-containing protein [Mycena amicta]